MSVYTIWRESDGNFVLKQGDTPIRFGDACYKRFDADGWHEAIAELYKFMDQRAKDASASG